jgi:hypothetical protein
MPYNKAVLFIFLPCTVAAVTAFSLFVIDITLVRKMNVFNILAQRKNR